MTPAPVLILMGRCCSLGVHSGLHVEGARVGVAVHRGGSLGPFAREHPRAVPRLLAHLGANTSRKKITA